ncbi:MAG: beta-glucosidase [Candidatus Hodarchaeales archaeon]
MKEREKSKSLNFDNQVEEVLNKLTVAEKIKLLAGNRFYQTHSLKRLRIKPFKMTDGPMGVSRHSSFFRKNTKFPGGISLASTWNRTLAYQFGKALGEETRAVGRHAILAPGINIARSPLNGRTYEYFSEDPLLTKEIAIPMVKGIQTNRIAACVKHYVANNQETNRKLVSAEIDERTLNEIYLRSFRDVIQESDPWMLMSAYNKVNGKYTYANKPILNDLLEKWNFSGFVVSDWFSLSGSDPKVSAKDCLQAGLSLEMPKANVYHPDNLLELLKSNKITIQNIDKVLRPLLKTMFRVGLFEQKISLPKARRNTAKHQLLAQRMAEESIVLLKNERELLPLNINEIQQIAVIGPNLKKKFGKLLYGGSTGVVPPHEITPFDGLRTRCKGKIKLTNDVDNSDAVIIVAGLNHDTQGSLLRGESDHKKAELLHGFDAEGTDRNRLELPEDQIQLINMVTSRNPNTIVLLINGSPIAMDEWLEKVPAVVEAWYPGMEGGHAIAKILFGDTSPSGKLPVTFPKSLDDSPAHKSKETFPGVDLITSYKEGIFIGYRHFEKEKLDPLFPFGFGLSYTSFKYSNLIIDTQKLTKDSKIMVSLDITNTGNVYGGEIVQIYSEPNEMSIVRPPKELIGFFKTFIEPSETQTIHIPIKRKEFGFYDIDSHRWKVESGNYQLMVGSSSNKVIMKGEVDI